MNLRPVTVQVSAESDDVMVLLRDAVATLKSGADVSSLVPDLVKAIDGATAILTDLKERPFAVVRAVVLRSLEIAETLTGQDVQPL